MWGCHGDPISAYPTNPLIPAPPPPPPPPSWLQTGWRKNKAWEKNSLVAQTMMVGWGGGVGEGGEEKRRRGGGVREGGEERRGKEVWCWWLGEQLVSRLATMGVLEFGFWGLGGIFCLVCLGLSHEHEFVVPSVISVPSIGSERELTV